MQFEWDENKRRAVLSKHGVDFRDIARAWLDDDIKGFRSDKGEEERFIGRAILGGRQWAVIYTVRDDRLRLISARKWKNRDDRKLGSLQR
jgi:hypothetical protein